MNGVEALLRLLVGTTVDGQFQLGEGAGFGVRKLTDTADPAGLSNGYKSTSAKCNY
jgi:hypothetical protein